MCILLILLVLAAATLAVASNFWPITLLLVVGCALTWGM